MWGQSSTTGQDFKEIAWKFSARKLPGISRATTWLCCVTQGLCGKASRAMVAGAADDGAALPVAKARALPPTDLIATASETMRPDFRRLRSSSRKSDIIARVPFNRSSSDTQFSVVGKDRSCTARSKLYYNRGTVQPGRMPDWTAHYSQTAVVVRVRRTRWCRRPPSPNCP
jgi:hypothetical protein